MRGGQREAAEAVRVDNGTAPLSSISRRLFQEDSLPVALSRRFLPFYGLSLQPTLSFLVGSTQYATRSGEA